MHTHMVMRCRRGAGGCCTTSTPTQPSPNPSLQPLPKP